MMHDVLSLLPDRLNIGIIVLDSSLRIMYWNGWLEKHTEKQAEEVAGFALPDLYPLFQKSLYHSFFEQVLQQGKCIFCSGALHPLFFPPASGAWDCRQNMQMELLKSRGKKYVLMQIFDITNQHKRVKLLKEEVDKRTRAEKTLKENEDSLKYRFKFEKMVSDISSFFVSLPSEQIDQGINYALKLAGEFFKADRSYVFQFSADGQEMSNTHQWCIEGVHFQIDKNQSISTDKFPWWVEQIRSRDYLYIPDVDSLPPEARTERREFEAQGIRSLLSLPMIKDGEIFGFIGFEGIREKIIWNEGHVTLLKVVVELISSAFTRYQAEERIRQLSFYDQLTGLYNRTYLEEEMKRLDTPRQLPLSIIMADLNGLKLVNDTYGHGTGDEMLAYAAYILRKNCREEDIIARWGGDEFIIFLPQTSQEETRTICKRISHDCSNAYVEDIPVSMALGSNTKNDAAENLLTDVLKQAEDNMYQHKLTESRSVRNAVLSSLIKTLGEKSYETEAHTRRMQEVALKIGEMIDLPDSELNRLGLLINLHDIGKINIPEEILIKRGPLTQREWEIVKRHPETGYRIARATEEFAHVAGDILAHHECWDGTGYPQGVKGEEIPLLARITAIADAFEVMTNGRPYKKPLSREEVVAELSRCSGAQFDPQLVETFLTVLEGQAEKGR